MVVAGTALIQARAQLDALGTFLDSTLSYKEPWTPVLLTALKSAAS